MICFLQKALYHILSSNIYIENWWKHQEQIMWKWLRCVPWLRWTWGAGVEERKWLSLVLRFKTMKKKWSLDLNPFIKHSHPKLVTKFLGLASSLPRNAWLDLLSPLFPCEAALNIFFLKLNCKLYSDPIQGPTLHFLHLFQPVPIPHHFPVFHDLDTFLKSSGQLFCRLSLSLDLSDVFSWWDWGFGVSVRKPQKWCVRLSAPFRGPCCQHVSSLVMITWMTWLRWCLSGLSL